MHWHATGWTLPLFAAALVASVGAVYAWLRRPAAGAAATAAYLGGAAAWCLVMILRLGSDDLGWRVLWTQAQYAFAGVLPLAWFAFGDAYGRREGWLDTRRLLALAAVPLLTALLALSPWHGLVLSSRATSLEEPEFSRGLVYGPVFWIFLAFSSGLFAAGAVPLVALLRGGRRLRRLQGGTILAAGVVPYLCIALRLSGAPFEVQPTGLVLTVGLWAFALAGLRLLDLVPVARDAVFDEIEVGVLVVDGRDRVVDLNACAGRTLGLGRGEALGLPVAAVLSPWHGAAAAVAAGGVTQLRLGTGVGARDVELRSRMLGGDEAPGGRLVVWRDVTEERQAERRRQELTDALVHDLRTPLTTMRGALELLILSSAPDRLEVPRLALRAADKMRGLVDAILDVSRLEDGRLPLQLEVVCAERLVREAIERQALAASARGLRIEVAIAPGLPALRVDGEIVGRILDNLIGNAIKFGREGGRLRVGMERSPTEGFLCISVVDDGPGIPDEVGDRLFERFAAGRQPGRGSGLGLAFCRLAAEAHGGGIEARSPAEGGTALRVCLPAAPEGEQPQVARTASGPLVPPLRVLVVDDDEVSRQVARMALTHLGHRADLAEEGEDAVRRAASGYDVVLLDLAMPGLDGFETARRIRSALPPDRQPRIVAVTAAGAESRERCRREGIRDVLPKPLGVGSLEALLGRAVAQAR